MVREKGNIMSGHGDVFVRAKILVKALERQILSGDVNEDGLSAVSRLKSMMAVTRAASAAPDSQNYKKHLNKLDEAVRFYTSAFGLRS